MKDKIKKAVKENIIGKIIYGFLLFAPLLSILFTALYTTFNKNAYKSYSNGNIELRANTLQLNTNSKYYYNYFDDTAGQTNNTTPLITIDYISYELDPACTRIRFSNDNKIMQYDANNSIIGYIYNINNCTFTVAENITLAQQPWFKTYLLVQDTQPLDNSFNYGIQKVEETNYYNWAKTTGTYNVLVATCNGLGITNTFTPMLLTYWMIITIIYLVYDIALVFVLMVHRKIHELQESI